MDTSLYVNLSNQLAISRELEVIAHNIANISTTGFRGERMLFSDALRKAGAAEDVSFVIDKATYTDQRSGALIETGNPFDIAVRGEGWLAVDTDDGVRYTRDGRLSLSTIGELVNLDGDFILDAGGAPIIIPLEAEVIDVGADGVVTADNQQVGRIGVYAFENPQALEREADGLFRAPENAAQPFDEAKLEQGMIEASNVEPILEITRLIELSRAYENAAKIASDVHDQKKRAIDKLGSAVS